MNIADVVKFEGPIDSLVWKFPSEDFNATSQLIVDETHEALLVVNGNAADLFYPGRRTLTLPNIPLANKLINIPTSGESPFTCKVFFINKVHQMDLLWGTQGPIALEDPLYEIFLHIMLHGSMSFQVSDSRKFLLKLVGFRDQFNADELTGKFRGIISSHIKDCISKIMINGMVSYFTINSNLFEISGVVKEKLDAVFEEYGIEIKFFNIETIEVPDKDYEAVTKAKERRTGRIIEGYTWQEERQMLIAEKFASNEGTMGGIGGAVGGFMMGGAFGGTISELARSALSEERIPKEKPPKDVSGAASPIGRSPGPFNVADFFSEQKPVERENGNPPATSQEGRFCPGCGSPVLQDAIFCSKCGKKLERTCPSCNAQLNADAAFCHKCGTKIV